MFYTSQNQEAARQEDTPSNEQNKSCNANILVERPGAYKNPLKLKREEEIAEE